MKTLERTIKCSSIENRIDDYETIRDSYNITEKRKKSIEEALQEVREGKVIILNNLNRHKHNEKRGFIK